MADNNDNKSKNIDKKLDNLSTHMDSLYQSNYLSRIDNKKNMDSVIGDINDNIDDIMYKINGRNVADISNLYVRLRNKETNGTTQISGEIAESIEEMFDSSQVIMDTINLDNIRRSIQAENYQYDLICKYMTKLEDALDIKKDNVLSSDNFTKDFINIVSGKSNKTYVDLFNDRAIALKDKYKIQDLFEDMYYKASKYGEYFLYEVPYTKAFKRLLERKGRLNNGIRYENAMIFEAAEFNGELPSGDSLDNGFLKEIKENDMKVNLIFDESGIIPEPIDFVAESHTVISNHRSLTESFYSDESDSITEAELKWNDGLSTAETITSREDDDSKKLKNINGTVLYEIPRENIIPIYMGKTAIGFIYLQVANDWVQNIVMNGNTYNTLTNNTKLMADDVDKQNDLLVSQISGMMAEKIDAKFINANINLKEEIYSVLRYNDHFCATHGTNNITVSFLPVDDVHHFYFRLNEKTHRGISDLDKAIVPAMIYCMLYLNNAIGTIGRAQDKRVYYVKQNVEQNVARTLLNVINQIKKGNMGMRQLENMNTIFNIIGKYNDHVIPVSQSGDPPIQMEVMQGQQVETPTDLMDRMEDMAVSSVDVPLEFVQSVNSVDYASRFTMSNSKFLRKVFKRQRICQEHFTTIFRKIYNFEFDENDTSVKILLPAPAYLSMSNTQQLIDNTKNYVQAISDIVLATEEDDKVKQHFMNLTMRNYLGTYIDFGMIDDMVTEARIKAAEEAVDEDISDTGDDSF